MKMVHYEIETNGDVLEFETLEEAIDYAEENGCTHIDSIGGSWDEWEKCEFCGDWCPISELNIENYCDQCQIAIKDHGFVVDPRRKSDIYY